MTRPTGSPPAPPQTGANTTKETIAVPNAWYYRWLEKIRTTCGVPQFVVAVLVWVIALTSVFCAIAFSGASEDVYPTHQEVIDISSVTNPDNGPVFVGGELQNGRMAYYEVEDHITKGGGDDFDTSSLMGCVRVQVLHLPDEWFPLDLIDRMTPSEDCE